jgi:chorismate synthase
LRIPHKLKRLLSEKGIKIAAYTKQIGNIIDNDVYSVDQILQSAEHHITRTIKSDLDEKMIKEIESVKEENDSVGGVITCMIENVPVGTGSPMFHSLESDLAAGMFSIPAIKGIEFGAGFKSAYMRGSQHNDTYRIVNDKVITETNNNGGITGGLATGMPIVFNVVVKPTASIGKTQNTVNLKTMKNDTLTVVGRHDPCIVPRAVPVVEAMAAIVMIQFLL